MRSSGLVATGASFLWVREGGIGKGFSGTEDDRARASVQYAGRPQPPARG